MSGGQLHSLAELAQLVETVDRECKLAQGQDGKGELPRDFWPTYSAMANMQGGASDCRNRTLHQMFLFINLGERAGSGLPKIHSGWEAEGHGMRLFDSCEPFDQTRLEMEWSAAATEASPGDTEKTPGKTPGKTPERILEALKAGPSASVPELAARLGKSESAVERAIRRLREDGRLRRVGPAKGGHWEVLE